MKPPAHSTRNVALIMAEGVDARRLLLAACDRQNTKISQWAEGSSLSVRCGLCVESVVATVAAYQNQYTQASRQLKLHFC
jgi:ribosomal protein L7Ae-like RNA K-turn-binding protein